MEALRSAWTLPPGGGILLPMRHRLLAAAVMLALGSSTALTQTVVTPADRTELGLTVYPGFAQVRDVRRANLSEGGGAIVWSGVPSSIDPGTIVLTADGRPVTVRLQTFAPAAYAEGAVLARHVGGAVTLVSPSGERIDATLVSLDGPVFRVGDHLIVGWKGHVEVPLGPGFPEGAAGGPAIRFAVDGVNGETTLAASYLAGGLSWAADYVAVMEADASSMRLDGRITVDNGTDSAFPDATLQVVAGEVRRDGGGPIPLPSARMDEMAVASAPDVGRAPLGDYHIYTLDTPVSVAAYETVQVPLFGSRDIDVDREYVLNGQQFWFQGRYPEPQPLEHPEIRLTFENAGLAGDDEPLPAGTLHTYVRDDANRLQFTGDAPIPNTPAGEQIIAVIGSAFDLVAERTQTDYRQLDERTHESAWRIEIRNRGREDRTVTVIEPLAGDWTILEESHTHERVDAQTVQWEIPVPARGEAILTYRVRATTS